MAQNIISNTKGAKSQQAKMTAVGDNESCILILNLIKQFVRIYFLRHLIETVETVNRPVDYNPIYNILTNFL